MKKKNVLLVFVVILVPIVIMGALAVGGAENFQKQKEAAEHQDDEGTESTEAIVTMVPTSLINMPFSVTQQPAGLTG